MTPAIQENQIRAILSHLTAIPAADIQPTDRLKEDLGLDSVGSMELVSMLAEQFDIDVELEEAAGVSDVAGVLALARRHLS